MLSLIIRIIEKLLIIYFSAYFIFDFFLFLSSLFSFKTKKRKKQDTYNYRDYPVSIVVPAYNEDVSIVQCMKMLLEVDYPDFELIIINDGSKDNTGEKIISNFGLKEVNAIARTDLNTKRIKKLYTDNTGRILLIDKENGGKADSINAGINYSTKKFICTIDADSILDSQALKKVMSPIIKNHHIFVSGGQLAAANDVVILHNKVISSKMPANLWVLWQIIEYIKSFMISRIGLSKIDALLIMSGAFSIYKRDDLLKVGGFLTAHNIHPYIVGTIGKGYDTVCEDMEIVVRLWRYYRENKLKGKATFIPDPVCWTEMPEKPSSLYKQRVRWHLGLAQTMKIHRRIIFEPRYSVTGLVAMPYYLIFELLSPVVKLFSLIFLIIASVTGLINTGWVLLLLLSILLTTAIITSSVTVFIESWSEKQTVTNRQALRYKTFRDWLWLLGAGVLGDFSYAFFRMYAQLMGIISFLKKKNEWNKFERKGVKVVDGISGMQG